MNETWRSETPFRYSQGRSDIGPYIDLLEAIAEWLMARGVRQYAPGAFRDTRSYFATSIERGEVCWAGGGADRGDAHTQATNDDGARPDLAAFDERDKERVPIE